MKSEYSHSKFFVGDTVKITIFRKSIVGVITHKHLIPFIEEFVYYVECDDGEVFKLFEEQMEKVVYNTLLKFKR